MNNHSLQHTPHQLEKACILAIESSCDDTSAAVLRDGFLLSNVTASQAVHKAYGGVVPELASRAHQQNIVPVVDQALKQAGVTKGELSAVAVTLGPGLMGSLLVGVSLPKDWPHRWAYLSLRPTTYKATFLPTSFRHMMTNIKCPPTPSSACS